jgi:hypothetical protein
LNHISPYFADVVWRGLSTTHVREGLEGAVELDRLRQMWLPISPHMYLDRIKDRKTLLVYAKYDLTFPVDLSRELVDEFNRRKIPHELAVLPCGHYSTGLAPFKFLDGFLLARFLKETCREEGREKRKKAAAFFLTPLPSPSSTIVQQIQQRLVDDVRELGDERPHCAALDRVGHGHRIRQQQPDESAGEYRRYDGDSRGKADAEARRAHRFTVWAIAEWVPLILQPPTAVTQ